MLKSIAVSLGLLLSASPVLAQESIADQLESLLVDSYGQAGANTGWMVCQAKLSGATETLDITYFLLKNLDPQTRNTFDNLGKMNEDNYLRIVFEYNFSNQINSISGCSDWYRKVTK